MAAIDPEDDVYARRGIYAHWVLLQNGARTALSVNTGAVYDDAILVSSTIAAAYSGSPA